MSSPGFQRTRRKWQSGVECCDTRCRVALQKIRVRFPDIQKNKSLLIVLLLLPEFVRGRSFWLNITFLRPVPATCNE